MTSNGSLRCVTGALLACLAPICAWAAPEVTLLPSAAVACLAPAAAERVQPVYPDQQLRLKESATVGVELVFDGPDSRPDLKFDDWHHDIAFDNAIRDYARQLRVPCMARGAAPVRLRQEFVFRPNDGRKVVYTSARDLQDVMRKKALECAVVPKGGAADIRYPSRELNDGKHGTVVLKLRFTDPSKPPSFDVVDNAGSPSFVHAVEPYVDEIRVPCLGAEPVDVHFFFNFMFDGMPPNKYILNDMPLTGFLRLSYLSEGVFFDTTTMGCPFDVRVKFRQPYDSNEVSELEEDVPARHVLLDWLAGLRTRVPPEMAKELHGQEATVHVPCGQIDL